MITLEEVPQWIIDLRNTWVAHRDRWLQRALTEEEIYYNDVEETKTNFTKEQLEKIQTKSGVPVNLNLLYPFINQKLAILANSKPAFRLVGLDERGKQYAEVLDKAVKSIMYNSEATGEEEETIKAMLNMGMGISIIEEKDYYQYGSFGIQYADIHPSMVVLDANSRKRSMIDARGFFIEKEITIDEARNRYGMILNAINEERIANGDVEITMEYFAKQGTGDAKDRGKIDSGWQRDGVIDVKEFYSKKFTKMYFVPDEKGGVRRMFKENLLTKEAEFVLGGAKDVEENMFIRKHLILGNYLVAIVILPITQFPIKVKYFEWGGKPYKCYSMIHFELKKQETMDKAVQLMITNGMLTNNAGYMSPKGGIALEDKDKWETLGNKPGIVKEFVPTVIGGQAFIPQREQIQQLSNFYPMLIQMMGESIRTSTGVFSTVTGDAQEAKIDVFSSLKQYQDASMQRIRLAMSHINLANQALGNITLEYLLANIDTQDKYVFFDDNTELKELSTMNNLLNEMSMGRYKVLSVPAEALPTQKLSMANSLMQISQTTPDPVERNIYIQKAFELSDMRAFDDVKQQVDVAKKLQSQVGALQDQIKRLEEINKQYENKYLNAEMKAKLAERLADMEAELAKAETVIDKEVEIQKLKTQLKEANKSDTKEQVK